MNPQAEILEMLKERKVVSSREFIRECSGWDFRKCITRLRKKGYPIENINPPGMEAVYVYKDGSQMELF